MEKLITGLIKDHISVVFMRSNERYRMNLLTSLAIYFKCSPKFNLSSKKYRGAFGMEFKLPGYY